MPNYFTMKDYTILYGLPALNDSDQHNDNSDDQQDMDKMTHGIASHQSQQSQNDHYDGDCP
jgi:hypothetical protein